MSDDDKPEVDWRLIFQKYNRHVGEEEGVDFMRQGHAWTETLGAHVTDFLTPDERAAAEAARSEYENVSSEIYRNPEAQ